MCLTETAAPTPLVVYKLYIYFFTYLLFVNIEVNVRGSDQRG